MTKDEKQDFARKAKDLRNFIKAADSVLRSHAQLVHVIEIDLLAALKIIRDRCAKEMDLPDEINSHRTD